MSDRRVSRVSRHSFASRPSFVGSIGGSSNRSESFLHDESDVPPLSDEEETRAKRLFHDACREAAAAAGASFTSAAREIGPAAFSKLITQLTKEANEVLEAEAVAEAKRRGGNVFKPELQPLPKEKDLRAAFKLADADSSGAVDEDEFLVLFRKVKAGKVAGLGGSFWNPFSGIRMSASTHQAHKAVSLTGDEEAKAKSVFEAACIRANQISGAPVVLYELDEEAFEDCIGKLTEEANERATEEGGSGATQPMPTKSDLHKAFEIADADESGMIDEEEFIELYAKVKAGKVKGLGGGFFKSAAGSLMKAVHGLSGQEAPPQRTVATTMTAQARSIREQTIEIHQWLDKMGFDTDNLDRPAPPKYSGDPHTSPMALACKNGKIRVCAWLLTNGQDIHKVDCNGDTPLHLAARAGNLGVCRWLLESGAQSDICSRNSRGETPIMTAVRNANHAVLELLRDPESQTISAPPPSPGAQLATLQSPARLPTPEGRRDLQELVRGRDATSPSPAQNRLSYQQGWVVHGMNGTPTKLDPHKRPFWPDRTRQLSPTSNEAVQQHFRMLKLGRSGDAEDASVASPPAAVDSDAEDRSVASPPATLAVEAGKPDEAGEAIERGETGDTSGKGSEAGGAEIAAASDPISDKETGHDAPHDDDDDTVEIGVEQELSTYFWYLVKRGKSKSKALGQSLMGRVDSDARHEIRLAQLHAKEAAVRSKSSASMSSLPLSPLNASRIHPEAEDDASFASLSSLSNAHVGDGDVSEDDYSANGESVKAAGGEADDSEATAGSGGARSQKSVSFSY